MNDKPMPMFDPSLVVNPEQTFLLLCCGLSGLTPWFSVLSPNFPLWTFISFPFFPVLSTFSLSSLISHPSSTPCCCFYKFQVSDSPNHGLCGSTDPPSILHTPEGLCARKDALSRRTVSRVGQIWCDLCGETNPEAMALSAHISSLFLSDPDQGLQIVTIGPRQKPHRSPKCLQSDLRLSRSYSQILG